MPPQDPPPPPAEAAPPAPTRAPAPPLGPRGASTRARIVEAAFALFAEKGYERTSMRDIATRAGCALGLIYRYFRAREDLALELYRRQAEDAAARIAALPPGTLRERFVGAMHAKIDAVAPHRDVLRALASASLDRDNPIAVLGPGTAEVREVALQSLRRVVDGASDAPAPQHAAAVVHLLFVAQLLVVLALTQDPTPDGRHARALVALVADALASVESLGPAAGALLAPLALPLLARADALYGEFVGAAGVATGAPARPSAAPDATSADD